MVKYNHDEIKRKQALLQVSRDILKKEFVGIDTVIDKVIDSISTWFIFPELQETPVIINLWGMTGVGKTALIIRLSYLLEFDKKFFVTIWEIILLVPQVLKKIWKIYLSIIMECPA
jgi:ATP-dependent Lon protease